MKYRIPFNKPSFAGKELEYIKKAVASGHISGDGDFSKECVRIMKEKFFVKSALLTPSGTSALEMTGLLMNPRPGDEFIIPSFTFSSTANCFMLFGGIPKFTDIREDTLNIDEAKIEEKISKKTKAIYCMHYAGVGCEMDELLRIGRRNKLPVIEDAAQGINAKYRGKFLGTIGDLGIYSFHETKNINCGEGGALLINDLKYLRRAEIIREKGSDRAMFFRGEVDKYTWRDIGSSYLLSEVLSAYLLSQLEKINAITASRKKAYTYYQENLKFLEGRGLARLPVIPEGRVSNYHIFHLVFSGEKMRNEVMDGLKKKGILSVFHYLPLHLSPMGRKMGYKKGDFPVTEKASSRLLRLPLYNGITERELETVVKNIRKILQ